MLNDIQDFLIQIVGDGPDDLNPGNLAVRSVLTFVVTVAILRLGDKRLFGKGTTFDTVVAIMIGSVMSRAITGSGSGTMIATWTGGAVLIGLHWMLGWLAYRSGGFGPLIKGSEVKLVDDGQILEDGMAETSTTLRDLDRAIRDSGKVPDVSQIKLAYLERDGSISVIPKSPEPRVLEVTVRDGVQTVRIALE